MARSKKTLTKIVFYEPENDAEFYKLCGGGISFPAAESESTEYRVYTSYTHWNQEELR